MTTTASDCSVPVTLVVALRQEEESIADLLQSIRDQTTSPQQVLLVDGGSTDRTVQVMRDHVGADSRFRIIEAGPATPGRGRNIGVAASRTEWLAFTDGGIRLEPRWLARLWSAHLDAPDAEIVFGNYEFDTRSVFEEVAALAYGGVKRNTPAGRCRGPVVPSCMVRRDLFDEVGGFPDLRAAEDEMFLRAVSRSGAGVAWAPSATAWWRLRPDLRSTFERFRLYSYHNVMAGQERHWHHPLARRYAPVLVGALLTRVVPAAWVLAVAPVALRVAARLWRHGRDLGVRRVARPDRIGGVTFLMLACDVATVVGWVQAVLHQRRGAPPPAGEAH